MSWKMLLKWNHFKNLGRIFLWQTDRQARNYKQQNLRTHTVSTSYSFHSMHTHTMFKIKQEQ